ncbi:MAG: hypothetical protein ACI9K2_004069 [Myxococcota bacterium]
MTVSEGPSHEDLLRKVKRVVDDGGDLVAALQFTRLTDSVRDRRSRIDALTSDLARVRSRGFVFKAGLEAQLAEARSLAPDAVDQVLAESRQVGDRLSPRVDALVERGRQLAMDGDLTGDTTRIDLLEDEHKDLQSAVRDAERRLQALTDPVVKAVDAVVRSVKEATEVLDAFEAATFQLQPGEQPVAAVGASWEDAPGGAKKGRLFLTAQRVRFEQDEEIVTKKTMFFFAAEKKRVQKLWIDEPVGHLASSDDTTRGWVFKDQVLAFAWDKAAKARGTTTFEVERGSAKEWDTLVESIRDGSIAADAASTRVEEAPLLRFPEKCSACAGSLPPAVKGQVTLTCPYCTTVNSPLA